MYLYLLRIPKYYKACEGNDHICCLSIKVFKEVLKYYYKCSWINTVLPPPAQILSYYDIMGRIRPKEYNPPLIEDTRYYSGYRETTGN